MLSAPHSRILIGNRLFDAVLCWLLCCLITGGDSPSWEKRHRPTHDARGQLGGELRGTVPHTPGFLLRVNITGIDRYVSFKQSCKSLLARQRDKRHKFCGCSIKLIILLPVLLARVYCKLIGGYTCWTQPYINEQSTHMIKVCSFSPFAMSF